MGRKVAPTRRAGYGDTNGQPPFLLDPPPRHDPRRRRDAARQRRRHRRQRRCDDRACAGGDGARRRPGGIPRAEPDLLCGRRPPPPDRPAPCDRGGDRRGGDRERDAVDGAAGRRRAAAQRAALQLRAGDRARAHPWRGAQDLPAKLSRVLREALVRQRRRDRGWLPHHRRRPVRPVRHRPAVRGGRPGAFRLPRGNLRGLLVADAALDDGRAGRRVDLLQPVGVQRRDRQVARAADAVRVAERARPLRLCLFRRRTWGEHHRPRLGRPGHRP